MILITWSEKIYGFIISVPQYNYCGSWLIGFESNWIKTSESFKMYTKKLNLSKMEYLLKLLE